MALSRSGAEEDGRLSRSDVLGTLVVSDSLERVKVPLVLLEFRLVVVRPQGRCDNADDVPEWVEITGRDGLRSVGNVSTWSLEDEELFRRCDHHLGTPVIVLRDLTLPLEFELRLTLPDEAGEGEEGCTSPV
jgi:hypothetical protein